MAGKRSEGDGGKVTSIAEAIERKAWERLRAQALAKHTRALEALVESAEFSRGLEATDFDALLAEIDAQGDDADPEARARVRCARAVRSCQRGDTEAGFREWDEIIAESPGLALPYVVRARWRMSTDTQAALADLDRGAQVQPSYAAVYFARGECFAKDGDADRALANYRRGLALAPDAVDGLLSLAKLLASRGEHAEAVSVYNRLVAAAPGYVDIHWGRAASLEETGAFEAALRDWERILELVPGDRFYRFSRAMCLHSLGRDEEAAAGLGALVAEEPGDVVYQRMHALVLASLGRHEEALAPLDRVVALAPDEGDSFAARARSYAHLGRIDDALADYDRALELEPASEQFALERLVTQLGAVPQDQVRAEMEAAAERHPETWFGAEIRARKLCGEGRFEEAIEAFTTSLAGRPEAADVWMERAKAHAHLDRAREAFEDATHAIEHDPKMAFAYTARAIYRTHLEGEDAEPQRVMADFDRGVELAPRDAAAHFHRGRYLFECENEFEKALEDFARVIEAAPKLGEAYYWRACCLVRVFPEDSTPEQDEERGRRARDDLDRAIELGYVNADVYWERATAKEILGDQQGKAADLARAGELDPELKGMVEGLT